MTQRADRKELDLTPPRQPHRREDQRLSWNPETLRLYRPPRLIFHGELGALIRGASHKGTDSVGELDPSENYPS
jgi:hypothetical protein